MADPQAEGEEGPLDLGVLLEDLVSRNRHVSGMALLRQDGVEGDDAEPVAVGLAAPDAATVAALNGNDNNYY